MSGERRCAFCDYAGPSEIVHSAPNVYVIEPLEPVTPGHLLVIPRRHVEDFTTNPAVTANVVDYAARVVRWQGIDDCNLITSRGSAATQTVGHLHLHIVPRRQGDGLMLPWSASLLDSYKERVEELEEALREIAQEPCAYPRTEVCDETPRPVSEYCQSCTARSALQAALKDSAA